MATTTSERTTTSAVQGLKLPRIEHPALHRSTVEGSSLALKGSRLANNRRGRVRPSSVPTALPAATWRQVSQHEDESLYHTMEQKLRTKWFFTVKNAFNAFDPLQRGTVSREALYRILCNTLERGATRRQYADLLERLRLAHKQQIGFWELLGRFQLQPTTPPHWTGMLGKSRPRPLSNAERIHSLLRERALNCDNISSYMPQLKDVVTKADFSMALSDFSIYASNEEIDKLWSMYDPTQRGQLSRAELMDLITGRLTTDQQATTSRPPSDQRATTSRPPSDQRATSRPPSDQQATTSRPPSDQRARPASVNKLEELPLVGTNSNALISYLHEKLYIKSTQVVDALRSMDELQSGKVTPDQLCSALQCSGIPLTLEQCQHLLDQFGMCSTGAVDYMKLLHRLMSTANTSLPNAVLTAPDTHFQNSRACLSTADAQMRLVCLLNASFMKLLAEFRSADAKGKGLITREHFISVLQPMLPQSHQRALYSLADQLTVESNLVAYPKFLAMFEQTDLTTATPSSVSATDDDDESSDQLLTKLSLLASESPHQILKVMVEQDVRNTGRLTHNGLQQLLFRLGLCSTPNAVKRIWTHLLKNKDGTVDHSELIRHFGRRRWTFSHYRGGRINKPLKHDQLKTTLVQHRPVLEELLQQCDTQCTGYVPSHVFYHALRRACSKSLTSEQAYEITMCYQDEPTGCVCYRELLKSMLPPTYITGNNLTQLLAQKTEGTVASYNCPSAVSCYPQHGLPGAWAELQRKLVNQWRSFRRSLVHHDPTCSGLVPTELFLSVLERHGVQLSKHDGKMLMGCLDTHHTGSVDYVRFIDMLS